MKRGRSAVAARYSITAFALLAAGAVATSCGGNDFCAEGSYECSTGGTQSTAGSGGTAADGGTTGGGGTAGVATGGSAATGGDAGTAAWRVRRRVEARGSKGVSA